MATPTPIPTLIHTLPLLTVGSPARCSDGNIRIVIGLRREHQITDDRLADDGWEYLLAQKLVDGWSLWGWEFEDDLVRFGSEQH